MRNRTGRITAEQASEIRQRHRGGESIYALGEEFGMGPAPMERRFSRII
jgi:hypothetical protein